MPVPDRRQPRREVRARTALLSKCLEIEEQGERPVVPGGIAALDLGLDLRPGRLTSARERIELGLAGLFGRLRLPRLRRRCLLGGRLRAG